MPLTPPSRPFPAWGRELPRAATPRSLTSDRSHMHGTADPIHQTPFLDQSGTVRMLCKTRAQGLTDSLTQQEPFT